MCKCVLPPGVNPTAVDKHINISYIRDKTDNSFCTIRPTDVLLLKCVYPMLFIKDMLRPLSLSASVQYISLVYYSPFVVSVLPDEDDTTRHVSPAGFYF
jgi:hypothetical protein